LSVFFKFFWLTLVRVFQKVGVKFKIDSSKLKIESKKI